MFSLAGIPGLSFDIMLKTYGGGLELLSDREMEAFFSRGIRGGQSFISQRKAEGEKHPEKAGHHLLYVDGKTIFFFLPPFLFHIFNFFLSFQPIIYTAVWKR